MEQKVKFERKIRLVSDEKDEDVEIPNEVLKLRKKDYLAYIKEIQKLSHKQRLSEKRKREGLNDEFRKHP